jgi:hypothetical protein
VPGADRQVVGLLDQAALARPERGQLRDQRWSVNGRGARQRLDVVGVVLHVRRRKAAAVRHGKASIAALRAVYRGCRPTGYPRNLVQHALALQLVAEEVRLARRADGGDLREPFGRDAGSSGAREKREQRAVRVGVRRSASRAAALGPTNPGAPPRRGEARRPRSDARSRRTRAATASRPESLRIQTSK